MQKSHGKQAERPGDQASFVAASLHVRLCHAFILLLAAAALACLWLVVPAATISQSTLAAIGAAGALLASGAVTLVARTVRRRAHWRDPGTGLSSQRALAALGGPLGRKSRWRSQPLTLVALEVRSIPEHRRRSEHAVADQLARATARHLLGVAGPDGFAFRMGDSQFLCLLPNRMREETVRALRKSMGHPCHIGIDAGAAEIVAWPQYRVATLTAAEDVLDACQRALRELGTRAPGAVARPRPDTPRAKPVLADDRWERPGNGDVATVPMPLQASASGPTPNIGGGLLAR